MHNAGYDIRSWSWRSNLCAHAAYLMRLEGTAYSKRGSVRTLDALSVVNSLLDVWVC